MDTTSDASDVGGVARQTDHPIGPGPMGCPISRRRFLQGLGVGAAATTVSLAPSNAAGAVVGAQPTVATSSQATFGRLFPQLPPFAEPGTALTDALMDIGRPEGLLDANDDLSAGPIALITDPALSLVNRNNAAHPAGITFLGQFLDHDMTFDVGSTLNVPADVARATNGRTPHLDLDSVYGSGPVASASLYDPADRAKLRVESGGTFEDVPRATDMTAIIADPRNDEHLIIAGLQCAFLKFHNQVVDTVRAGRERRLDDFTKARRLATWHCQWLIVHEVLPLFVGQALVDDILANGRRFYRPAGASFIPVEFQGAAYRFGHSMIRPSYRANLQGNADASPFFGFIFDASLEDSADPDDLVGGHQPTVLPQRTLLRHVTWSLPSGQAIAAEMGAAPLTATDFPELSGYGLGLDTHTPLFYYVLKEAELMEDGLLLGPVGGRIVAEVFLGLLPSTPVPT